MSLDPARVWSLDDDTRKTLWVFADAGMPGEFDSTPGVLRSFPTSLDTARFLSNALSAAGIPSFMKWVGPGTYRVYA